MFPSKFSHRIKEIMDICPIIPVVEIEDAKNAEPIAEALLKGGISVLEVTLRTTAALDVIKILANYPGLTVGAGTLLLPEHVHQVVEAGAKFGVSPGSTGKLIASCEQTNLPMLPGVATVTEMMVLSERGFQHMKFFPAEVSGGVKALKSIASPLPHLKFCPTGGVTKVTASEYLVLSNVLCVGGSWIAPKKAISMQNWSEIEQNARSSLAVVSNDSD